MLLHGVTKLYIFQCISLRIFSAYIRGNTTRVQEEEIFLCSFFLYLITSSPELFQMNPGISKSLLTWVGYFTKCQTTANVERKKKSTN